MSKIENNIYEDNKPIHCLDLICVPTEGEDLLSSPIEYVLAFSIPENHLHAGRKFDYVKGKATVVYGENVTSSYPATFKFYKRKNKLKFDENNPRGMYDYMDYDDYDRYSVTFDGKEHPLPPSRLSYNRIKGHFCVNVQHSLAWRQEKLTLEDISSQVEYFNAQFNQQQIPEEIEM